MSTMRTCQISGNVSVDHQNNLISPVQVQYVQSYRHGLPNSRSYHAGLDQVLSQESSVTSPETASTQDSSSVPGHMTEPRNYAPRTSGPLTNLPPPPRFNLNIAPKASGNTTKDPFVAPISAPSNDLIPFPRLPSAEVQQAMVTSYTQDIQAERSEKLRNLLDTPSGMPTYEAAMNPAFFPFVDGPRQARPHTFGVVRLKNVSHCESPSTIHTTRTTHITNITHITHITHIPPLITNPLPTLPPLTLTFRFPFQPNVLRSWPSWAGTHGCSPTRRSPSISLWTGPPPRRWTHSWSSTPWMMP